MRWGRGLVWGRDGGAGRGRRDEDRERMEESTGTSTLRNMEMPLTASLRAISCGVETMTAPGLRISPSKFLPPCVPKLWNSYRPVSLAA